MNKFIDIFTGNLVKSNRNIIESIDIDSIKHSEGLIRILKYFEPDYKFTPEISNVFGQLFQYFTGNLNCPLDLNKGIAIFGNVGTGKTLMMKAIKEYTKNILHVNSFIWHDAKDIISNVNLFGNEYFDEINFRGGKPTTIYIDDIASGNETIKNYGTEINVIESLMTLRYINFTRYGKLTHITSNKYPSELKEIYGERLADRFREMFNVLELTGQSFRE